MQNVPATGTGEFHLGRHASDLDPPGFGETPRQRKADYYDYPIRLVCLRSGAVRDDASHRVMGLKDVAIGP